MLIEYFGCQFSLFQQAASGIYNVNNVSPAVDQLWLLTFSLNDLLHIYSITVCLFKGSKLVAANICSQRWNQQSEQKKETLAHKKKLPLKKTHIKIIKKQIHGQKKKKNGLMPRCNFSIWHFSFPKMMPIFLFPFQVLISMPVSLFHAKFYFKCQRLHTIPEAALAS